MQQLAGNQVDPRQEAHANRRSQGVHGGPEDAGDEGTHGGFGELPRHKGAVYKHRPLGQLSVPVHKLHDARGVAKCCAQFTGQCGFNGGPSRPLKGVTSQGWQVVLAGVAVWQCLEVQQKCLQGSCQGGVCGWLTPTHLQPCSVHVVPALLWGLHASEPTHGQRHWKHGWQVGRAARGGPRGCGCPRRSIGVPRGLCPCPGTHDVGGAWDNACRGAGWSV